MIQLCKKPTDNSETLRTSSETHTAGEKFTARDEDLDAGDKAINRAECLCSFRSLILTKGLMYCVAVVRLGTTPVPGMVVMCLMDEISLQDDKYCQANDFLLFQPINHPAASAENVEESLYNFLRDV